MNLLEGSFWGALIRTVIFLPLVILAAYFFIKYGLTKKYFVKKKSHLKIIERVYLSNKAFLSIVQVGDKYFLIGSTENQVTLLKEFSDYPKTLTEDDRRGFDNV